ncbi:MAG: 50S ribosomal protein L25 [Pyrinomonadaceae bacterium]
MAEKIIVKAEKREGRGKNDTRRLRSEGKLPVVVYGGGGENVAAITQLSDLAAILRTDVGVNTVFSFDLEGEVSDVIFQDRQIDGVKGRLLHADLRRIAKGEKMEMTVPIHLTGEAASLKEDGAVLSQSMREIKVRCEPAKAPESINVDIADLAVGHSLHVSDLKVEPGIEILEDGETVVASIVIVKEVELEPQLEEGAEPLVVGEEGSDAPAEGGDSKE